MKRRFLIGLASLAVVAALVCGLTIAQQGKNPAKKESIAVDSFEGGATTVNTKWYQSAIGENALSDTDKDYVKIDPDKILSTDSVVATDGVGRTLSTDGTGDNGRQVAVFYTLGHTGHTKYGLFQDVIDDGSIFQRAGQGFYWGESLFGFYNIDDDYVLRKHIEMFIYADVDYLVFDTTNTNARTTEALKLMKLLHEYNEMGWDAPKVAFYTNTSSIARIAKIYSDIYRNNKYPDTWYMVDGAPLIIGHSLPANCADFFTLRVSQWPNARDKEGGYPWMSFDDKAKVYYDFMGEHGVISVSTAQNCSSNGCFSDNVLYGMTATNGGCRGRSYHDGEDNITEDSVLYGYNFQEQWDHAIDSDAETAIVTQWNEWKAGISNATDGSGGILVFDLINMEYSRDIEPMTGGFGDNYYMQLVENIRQFKNTGTKVTQKQNVTIDIQGNFNQWNNIASTYADMGEGGIRRDSMGHGERYVNTTGRNEMIFSKVAQDSENVYFYVQTSKDITDDYTGSWMNLFLDTDGVMNNSWNGYEYIVNHSVTSGGVSTIAKYNGTEFETVGEAEFRVYGNQMMLSVPKSALGSSDKTLNLNFKWADSYEKYEDVMDFYTSGDVMPYGRFNYAYNAK